MPTCPCWKLTDACSCWWSYCTLACWKVPVPKMVRTNSFCWCLAWYIVGVWNERTFLSLWNKRITYAFSRYRLFPGGTGDPAVKVQAPCPHGADNKAFAYVPVTVDFTTWSSLLVFFFSIYAQSLISRPWKWSLFHICYSKIPFSWPLW